MEISQKKKIIFESTLNLIREQGFHGAPMSQIAKNAGVAAGTIYHYFDGKDQLICELYSYNRSRIIDVVKVAIREGKTVKENFLAIWSSMQSFYSQNPNVLVFFEQYINSPYKKNRYDDGFEDRPLFNFFVEGINNGTFKKTKPEILMVMVMSGIISTAKLKEFGTMPLTEDDLNQIVEIMWDGISLSSDSRAAK